MCHRGRSSRAPRGRQITSLIGITNSSYVNSQLEKLHLHISTQQEQSGREPVSDGAVTFSFFFFFQISIVRIALTFQRRSATKSRLQGRANLMHYGLLSLVKEKQKRDGFSLVFAQFDLRFNLLAHF